MTTPTAARALAASVALTLLVALAVIAGPTGPAPVRAADEAAAERARVLGHWTEARMRSAVPRDMTLSGSGMPGAAVGPAEVELASDPWDDGGAVAARSGKVFFTLDDSDFVCSASVIDDADDAAFSLVMTAAHCVYDEAADVFATEWIYIPDWHAAPTFDCFTVAYDCWTARALVVHTGWTNEESLTVNALRHDYAVAVVGPGLTTGGQADAMGAYPVRIGPVPAGESADIFGYPAAPPFQGDTLTHCAGPVTVSDQVGGWRMTCDMTGGASGGPWLHDADDPADGSGSLASVSSFRINGDSGLYGPKLDGATLSVLQAASAAVPDANGIDGIKVSGSTPTGPQVQAPTVSLVPGTRLGASTVPVKVTWSGTGASADIESYELREQTDGSGTWQIVPLSNQLATTINRSLTPGHAYQFEIRATDSAGNVATATGPSLDLRLSQQRAAVRTGTWRKVSQASASGGSYVYATAAGASFSFTFTGRGIAWVAPETPKSGKAKVYIDGVLIGRIGLHADPKRTRVMVFTRMWPTTGTHTIKVTVVGTAGHPRVNLDAFVRLD